MRWPILATLVLVGLSAPALGASKADRDDCAQQGDSEARVRGCTRVVEDQTETPRSRSIAANLRGITYRDRGDNDRALADFNRSVRLDPTYAVPHNNLGSLFRGRGNLERAINEYTQAIALNPKYAFAYSNRGHARLDRRDTDRALADCEAAIELAPNAAHGYGCRGSAHGVAGDDDRALADCDTALKLEPRYSAGFNCRGSARMRKGDTDGAIAEFNEAIKISPRYFYAYNNRGRAWISKGDEDRAIADFSEAIRINPNYRTAYRNRANAYTAKGDNERATADYATANRSQRETSAPATDTVRGEPQPQAAAAAPVPQRPAATTAAPPGRRVALVIGNSAYRAAPVLANPMRDADSVAATLRGIGFATVTTRNNVTRGELVAALRRFEDEAESAEWAVIYFAGHGVEHNGMNYLVPVDAALKSDRDLQDEAVPLERVLASVENAKKLRLVILDACRDNPFINQMRRSVTTRSIGRGLGSVEPDGGVLVAYAAKHGQVALDGDGSMSPFASALVKRLATPNLEINMLFRMVRDDVMNATAKRQEPFVYGSLPGEALYFVQK